MNSISGIASTIQNRVADRFKGADSNKDGALSQAEFLKQAEQSRFFKGTDAASAFSTMDTNGDASLTRDELQTAIQNRIQTAMENGGGLKAPLGGFQNGAQMAKILTLLQGRGSVGAWEQCPTAWYNFMR